METTMNCNSIPIFFFILANKILVYHANIQKGEQSLSEKMNITKSYWHGYFGEVSAHAVLHNTPQVDRVVWFLRYNFSACSLRSTIS